MSIVFLICIIILDVSTAIELETSNRKVTNDYHKPAIIDLLNDYLDQNPSQTAMVPVPGSNNKSVAYLFEDNHRVVKISPGLLESFQNLLLANRDGLTMLMSIRQFSNNVGSILSLGTENNRILELESSGWKQELRLHYRHKSRTKVEVLPFNLADNRWHSVALGLTRDSHLTLYIDCALVYEQNLSDFDKVTPFTEDVRLWIGQRNEKTMYFKGAIENMKIVFSPDGYLEQCPSASMACPTCTQFEQLQRSVKELELLVSKLTEKLSKAEERISELEKCDCPNRRCHLQGTWYNNGDSVPSTDGCATCTCREGAISCTVQSCPELRCKHFTQVKGTCCPVCLSHCIFQGKRYEHGEKVNQKRCTNTTCICDNGRRVCRQAHKTCPRLHCPKHDRIQVPGECCDVCKGTDFCKAGNHCHPNSTCVNLSTKYACQCNSGFQGDGKVCEDVNECKTLGGYSGHHCDSYSTCVNTPGSYRCDCLPGYEKVDRYNCRAIDVCIGNGIDMPGCHRHADCIRSAMSNTCKCRPGYEGNGFQCTPVCREPCQNGGLCIDVDICQCRIGYSGRHCNQDVDECLLDNSLCHENSVCVNIPGSFYCQCKDGYWSSRTDNRFGSLCGDVDECRPQWGDIFDHTCPSSSVCRNTVGGYTCGCNSYINCTTGCDHNGKVYDNGVTWQDSRNPCHVCQCQNGRASCRARPCDCGSSDQHSACCPQCRNSAKCRHQELPLSFQTGQLWQYNCQTCQCQNGETDCRPVSCPKLTCSHQVQDDGDCCPRCLVENDDPCFLSKDSLIYDPSAKVSKICVMGSSNFSLDPSQAKFIDTCSSCHCLHGHICCSYNQSCGETLSPSDTSFTFPPPLFPVTPSQPTTPQRDPRQPVRPHRTDLSRRRIRTKVDPDTGKNER